MHISIGIHENRKATPLEEYTGKYGAGGLIPRTTFCGFIIVIAAVNMLMN